jgi:hypothetical protein
MSEKEYNNEFRFSLYQEKTLLCEKIFNADQFNPFTRYSIDIRDILPRAITKLQKTLSKRSYDVIAEVGRIDVSIPDSENHEYDLYAYHQEMINLYPAQYRNEMRYNPTLIVQQIEEKTIRGVECKIGFYINNNPIVERLFYVDGFNPVARWSYDLTNAVVDIADTIFDKIKKSDIKNMWDDYDLINYRGLSINQIRELSTFKREEMLKKLGRN